MAIRCFSILLILLLCAPLPIVASSIVWTYEADSQLLEQVSDLLRGLWEQGAEPFCFSEQYVQGCGLLLSFMIIMVLCAIALVLLLARIVARIRALMGRNTRPVKRLMPRAALLVFLAGIGVYFLGYAFGGSDDSVITLLLRAILSALEMFLYKSNLIGVADNCRDSGPYMFCFALVHTAATLLSMAFAMACLLRFGRNWKQRCVWRLTPGRRPLHVFWGMNERSVLLARDIYEQTRGRERIVMVDLPGGEAGGRGGTGFAGLMGWLTYRVGMARQMNGVSYVQMRASEPDDPLAGDLLERMDLRRLLPLMKRASETRVYVLGPDDGDNLQVALNLLDGNVRQFITRLYCSARRTPSVAVLEECREGRLRIVDDSREAVMELSMRTDEDGKCVAQPIHFVRINSRLGCVDASEPFTALIVGMGSSGQEALRFLYEFSAFPDSAGRKTPVHIVAMDGRMDSLRGTLLQEIPALAQLEAKGEIELMPCDINHSRACQRLDEIIGRLNYVVIVTGEDDRNINLAARIYELAIRNKPQGLERFAIFTRLYNSVSEYKLRQTIRAYADNYAPAIHCFGNPKDLYNKHWLVDDEEAAYANLYFHSYCMTTGDAYQQLQERRRNELLNYNDQHLLAFRSLNRKLTQDRANCKHRHTMEVLLGLTSGTDWTGDIPSWATLLEETAQNTLSDWHRRLVNACICEHLRWNASHQMMGYVPMTPDEVASARTKCDERNRHHRCIVDWDELDAQNQSYDYAVVKTTLYLYEEDHRKAGESRSSQAPMGQFGAGLPMPDNSNSSDSPHE